MKSVRVTLELREDFIKLLNVNVELSRCRDKCKKDEAEPLQMLGALVLSESRGETIDKISNLLPDHRKQEIKIIHDQRRVFENGRPIKKKAG